MKQFHPSLNRGQSPVIEAFFRHLNKHIEANRRMRVRQCNRIVRYEEPIKLDELSIYRVGKIATWRGEKVQLSPVQYNLVNIIADVPGKFVSTEVLIDVLISKHIAACRKSIIRDVIEVTRRKFLSIDSNFDKIQYSKNKGCVWS